jgi:hypothetical protein
MRLSVHVNGPVDFASQGHGSFGLFVGKTDPQRRQASRANEPE